MSPVEVVAAGLLGGLAVLGLTTLAFLLTALPGWFADHPRPHRRRHP